ncbi:hypothetical protein TNCV_3971131 [Trichonephila clavipes]|nr:hypothetical protein TNCV_3971131 [Trichonephila clavipes]
MRTTPELAPPIPQFNTTPKGGLEASTDLTCINPSVRRVVNGNETRTSTRQKKRWLRVHDHDYLTTTAALQL